MKITFINKSDTGGGAAIACNRLAHAMIKSGHEICIVTDKKGSDANYVYPVSTTRCQKLYESFRFLYERFFFFIREKSKEVRFAFSLANIGVDISKHPMIIDSDIIHLHWINQGFLSIRNLKQLLKTNKPIVWTLHDMWAFTGGCHYSGECRNYLTHCHQCPFLKNPDNHDVSSKVWKKKKALFDAAKNKITLVCCSDWLREEAQKSSLLKDFRIVSIANPLDTSIFINTSKQEAKKVLGLKEDTSYILFGAMNIHDKRKGFRYFEEALHLLKKNPTQKIEILLLGKSKQEINLPFPVRNLSLINSVEKIVCIYNAADAFVLPSLEDNLPNTVAESMACGTPVIAFRTGGLPEMIDHKKNGYLAEFCNSADMAKGIDWVLHESDPKLSLNARAKAESKYGYSNTSKVFEDLYVSLLKK